MARIELRDCDVIFQDGFSGTAAINDTPADHDVEVEIDTVADLSNSTNLVPVGARFTVTGHTGIRTVSSANGNEVQTVTITATGGHFHLIFSGQTTAEIAYDALATAVKTALEALSNVGTNNVNVTGNAGGPYTVEFQGTLANIAVATMTTDATALTGVDPTAVVAVVHEGGTTWKIGFTPEFAAADLPGNNDVITFLPQRLTIKVGDGNITYTEHTEYEYLLDRGDLDTVREGKQVPMDVKLECVYEHITQGTAEPTSPMDALKGIGGAVHWVSASSDKCEPYAIDIIVVHTPPCGTSQIETTTFPDFRSDSREINLKDASISVSGKCKAVEPIVERSSS
jgi:hypothetical protein